MYVRILCMRYLREILVKYMSIYHQVPLPNIVTMTSPRKEFGSLLSKVPGSPALMNSPLRSTSVSPKPRSTSVSPRPRSVSPVDQNAASVAHKPSPKPRPSNVRKNLNLIDDMNSKDFVVIAPPPRKRRVLTEHQKEVMREQRTNIPALYSAADATQVGHVTIHV